MYWALLQHVKTAGVDPRPIAAHLKLCASGGAAMPLELMREFRVGVRREDSRRVRAVGDRAGRLFQSAASPDQARYGWTADHSASRCSASTTRSGSSPAGQPGEIVIRGPNVMKGYYNRPEATEEAMRHGWFHTGDIGTIDADGYVSIVDRKKDMIIRGGFNVYPREIEEVMLTHPAISLVAVIGVPDDRLGEEVKAVVVLKTGATLSEAELIDWCREQMAAFKYPRSIEFRDCAADQPDREDPEARAQDHVTLPGATEAADHLAFFSGFGLRRCNPWESVETS